MSTTPHPFARVATIVACAALSWGCLFAAQGVVVAQEKKAEATMFRLLDKSGDGTLTMDEATVGTRSILERIFKAAGKQPSDRVTREEFLAAHERLHSKATPESAKAPALSSPSVGPVRSSEPSPTSIGIGFIDTGGDGGISRAEWTKFTQAFKSLDVDKDGALSSAEVEATGGAAELLLRVVDANADGKISKKEWSMLPQSFAGLDANHDNSLDATELQKVVDAAVASASGSASLSSSSAAGDDKADADAGPTIWRGHIEGHGEIELVVNGNFVIGREFVGGGDSESLGAGTIRMTGDGKSGNLDAMYTTGTQAGQVCLGIYLRDGDNLLWCVNNRGWRPLWFTGATGDWLMTLTRVKPGPILGR